MGTNTDPYQQCEGRYRLTRGIVETLGAAQQPVLDPHEVDDGPARLDVLAAAAERTERARELLDRHARRGGLAHQRARHAAAAPARRGARAADRGGHPVRRAGRADPAGPLGWRGAALGGRAGVHRGGRGLDLEHRPAPAPGRARALHAVARARAARSRRRATSGSTARATATSRARSRSASARSCAALVERHGGCARSALEARSDKPFELRSAPVAPPPPEPPTQLRLVG